MRKGDSNTAFFHSSLRARRLKNKVMKIIDKDGILCDEPDTINNAFQDYYSHLLGQSRKVRKIHKTTVRKGALVKEEHFPLLLGQVTDTEIKEAMFSILDNKSLGPDGYSSHFFKKSWHITGTQVCKAIKEFFRTGKLLKQLNATNITLIPKIGNPQSVTHFRPIACCNVIYKTISKILCTKLNNVLPYIISSYQSAFVKGRDIMENILISHDLVRHYKRKNCSPRALMKIDLQKAYDSIEWSFVEDMLKALNFPDTFVHLIMECVKTPWYSINLNGSIFGFFKGERGLRQGDPISPLIFLMCMEYLSRVLSVGQMQEGFKYHPLCKPVKMTHLMFADDLLLFSRGDMPSVTMLLEAFNTFSQASGLQMNNSKSNLYVAGVSPFMANQLANITGIPRGSLPFKYLGVPISTKKISVLDSFLLVEKIVARIHALGARKLSYGGRLVLVKAVLSSLHNYWARIFILPSKTFNDINNICRNFLWQGHEHFNSAPPIAWSTVCQPRSHGGLDIVSPQVWNTAALGKYVWWIAQKKDHLWVKWINATYLKGRDWMEYTPPASSSWVWKQICRVKDKLKAGYVGLWWQHQGAQYSIAAGYTWLRTETPEVPWKDYVWNRISLPKQAFISWMVAHKKLRTKDRLSFLHLEDTSCYFCSDHLETHQHLFYECHFSSQCLNIIASWLDIPTPLSQIESWWIKLRVKSLMHKKYIAATMASLTYHVWNARNHCRIHKSVPSIARTAQHVIKEMKTLLQQDRRIQTRKHQTWARRLLN